MSGISVSSSTQLEAIYSMMDEGQHSVKIERHSLLIWGISAAFLILVTNWIFSRELIPVVWQRVAVHTIFISTILFLAGYWDFKLTRKLRQQRDESLSFIQLQLTKVWWFFVALIVLLNIGMSFFGGGYMFYGLTLTLIGIAFYIQGLFSTQMLKWIGIMLMVLGLGSIALNLHFLATKWLAAGVFGLGLPILAFILDKPVMHATLTKRLGLSALWFAIVIFPSMLAYQNELTFNPEGLPERSFKEYTLLSPEQAAQRQIIYFPAGSEIPVNINMRGELVEMNPHNRLAMILKKDTRIVIENGKANGHFQIDSSEWLNRISHLRTRDFKMESNVAQTSGPSVNLNFSLEIK